MSKQSKKHLSLSKKGQELLMILNMKTQDSMTESQRKNKQQVYFETMWNDLNELKQLLTQNKKNDNEIDKINTIKKAFTEKHTSLINQLHDIKNIFDSLMTKEQLKESQNQSNLLQESNKKLLISNSIDKNSFLKQSLKTSPINRDSRFKSNNATPIKSRKRTDHSIEHKKHIQEGISKENITKFARIKNQPSKQKLFCMF